MTYSLTHPCLLHLQWWSEESRELLPGMTQTRLLLLVLLVLLLLVSLQSWCIKHQQVWFVSNCLSHVLHVTLQWWSEEFRALLPRMTFVVGDMFKPSTLPTPREGQKTLYVLKQVLHDWSDTDSLAILRSIRAVISDEVRL